MRRVRAGGIAIVAVVLGLAMAGCGSDEKKDEATISKATTSPSAAPTTSVKAKPNKSIPDYIKENGITEAPVKRGDPGSPEINLPVPARLGEHGSPDTRVGVGRESSSPAIPRRPPIRPRSLRFSRS